MSEVKIHPFLSYLMEHLGANPKRKNNGMIACIKRAENPSMIKLAWETLTKFDIDIANEKKSLPFCLVGASLCKENMSCDGTLNLGKALALCFGKESEDQGNMRMRRILACTDIKELCSVLRHILSLIRSRAAGKLSYNYLLLELLQFSKSDSDREIVLARWAKDFWKISKNDKEDE